jgi:hypothetical protein
LGGNDESPLPEQFSIPEPLWLRTSQSKRLVPDVQGVALAGTLGVGLSHSLQNLKFGN